MRSSVINIKSDVVSNLATRMDQNSDSIYNSKLAIETLTKMYRVLEESDTTREIIVGLLLKIKGFNNYKLIVKDLNPSFISENTMDRHFQSLKTQCPNLIEIQLNKYKVQWSKYLKYKPISLSYFLELLTKAKDN